MQKTAPAPKRNALYYLKKDRHLYLMLLPGIVFFIIFRYAPMWGVLVAFKDYNLFKGFMASKWIGLKNFQNFFNDPFCFRIIKNTFLLSFYSLLWGFPMPIILSLMFNEVRSKHFKKITQTISYMPYFLSTVVIVGLINQLCATNGIFNIINRLLGWDEINYVIRPEWFRTLYIASGIWQGMGWETIIYLAALSGVDMELYEAATIDGAGRFDKIWHISLPSMLPVIVIQLILSCGSLLSVGFEKAYLLQCEATYSTSDVISTYVYRRGLVSANYGYSTAVDLFNSIISLILTLSVNFIAGKINETTLF